MQKPPNMPWISSSYAPKISSKDHASCLESMSKPPEHISWKNVLVPRNLKVFIPLAREPTVHCLSKLTRPRISDLNWMQLSLLSHQNISWPNEADMRAKLPDHATSRLLTNRPADFNNQDIFEGIHFEALGPANLRFGTTVLSRYWETVLQTVTQL